MHHPHLTIKLHNLSLNPGKMSVLIIFWARESFPKRSQKIKYLYKLFSPMPNVVYTTGMQPTNKTVVPFGATQANLEKVSVQTRCNSCCNEIYTRVNDKVSQNGICWAVLCCFCGSWLLSLLVLCMDGFKVYRHFCPVCNAFVGEYSPKMSGGTIALLVFLSLICVALQIFVVMYYFGRMYQY